MTRLAICIGVSNPGGGLDRLPGAINGARAFRDWAQEEYTVVYCTDEEEAVTRQRLHDEIHKTLNADTAYDRIIVYFAGHGCSVPTDDFWLLSGFVRDGNEAVSLDRLKYYLDAYQPKQIAIISDACRTIDGQFKHLIGSAVVDFPSTTWRSAAEVDIYRASSLGDPAYMIKDPDEAKARCLFSEILIRALAGDEPDAFTVRETRRVVSSGRLKSFLEKAVNTAGGRLQLSIRPHIEPGFQYPQDTYLEREAAEAVAPVTRTRSTKSLGGGSSQRAHRSEYSSRGGEEPLVRTPAPSPGPSRAVATRMRADLEGTRFSRSAGIMELFSAAPVSPPASGTVEVVCLGQPATEAAFSCELDNFVLSPTDRTAGWVTSCRIGDRRAASVGVKLDNGHWMFGSVPSEMQLLFAAEPEGAAAVILRQAGRGAVEYRQTAELLGLLSAGALTVPDARDIAAALRFGKHEDPIRGVVAAYLYDRVGDIDSIRQLAWFFAQREQPIPFDIALLSRLPGSPVVDGFVVDLPAVSARKPQSGGEVLAERLFRETGAVEGAFVGGCLPLARQGWIRLEPRLLPVHPTLYELSPGLTLAPFTTLVPPYGDQLAALIRNGEV